MILRLNKQFYLEDQLQSGRSSIIKNYGNIEKVRNSICEDCHQTTEDIYELTHVS